MKIEVDARLLACLAQSIDENINADDLTGYDAARSLIERLNADGYAIVPKEPTEEMADKGENALILGPLRVDMATSPSPGWAVAKLCYRNMLEAAGYAPSDDWQVIATAPRDGRVVDLTWIENGKPVEIWLMRWCHIQKNGLFPDQVGMWTATDGSVTWNENQVGGGPTHWRPHDDGLPV